MYWLPYYSYTSHHPSQASCLLLCHSKTDARFMQDGLKTVWSILYVSLVFFPSLKQNFIAYRSYKVSDCIFEIHQLWQSGFSRLYSNSCCSCWFEPEIIKISQSSHKMYSNNIVNFQVSTTILNAHTKKVWKLIVCTSYGESWMNQTLKSGLPAWNCFLTFLSRAFDEIKYAETPFPLHLFPYFFPISWLKLFPFAQKKSLMKHLTFNPPPLPATLLSSPSAYDFPHLLVNRKTQKKVSVWKSFYE